jgi:hypothetical protein
MFAMFAMFVQTQLNSSPPIVTTHLLASTTTALTTTTTTDNAGQQGPTKANDASCHRGLQQQQGLET